MKKFIFLFALAISVFTGCKINPSLPETKVILRYNGSDGRYIHNDDVYEYTFLTYVDGGCDWEKGFNFDFKSEEDVKSEWVSPKPGRYYITYFIIWQNILTEEVGCVLQEDSPLFDYKYKGRIITIEEGHTYYVNLSLDVDGKDLIYYDVTVTVDDDPTPISWS